MADVGDDLETTLDSQLDPIVWTGANADRFRAAWEEFTQHVHTQHKDPALAKGESASI
jgi:hypothetical protein